MEYYSAIKKNTFESVLMRWMKLEPTKASILWCSAFFMAQFSHPYMTTGKTVALTRWTFVGRVNVSAF